MKRTCLLMAVAIATAALAGSAQAVTTMWLTTDPTGAPVSGDTINVSQGGSVKLYCYMNSSDIGNTYEVMVGYDKSDAVTYGAGKDTNDGELRKLVLSDSGADIEGSMDSGYFGVLSSAIVDASGREASNLLVGGRPYGFVARGATMTNAALSTNKLLFSFTLNSSMTSAGDYQYVVVSNNAGGNSYSSAWKHGTALGEDSYALKVMNGSALPTVGASNKVVLDVVTETAAPNYLWVFWGNVTVIDSGKFSIDDGSGVIITVVRASHGLVGGEYVAVRGSLNATTKTLTCQDITQYR